MSKFMHVWKEGKEKQNDCQIAVTQVFKYPKIHLDLIAILINFTQGCLTTNSFVINDFLVFSHKCNWTLGVLKN